jgi:long-subunit fatty acid transport protein
MIRNLLLGSVALFAAQAAYAGGVERMNQSVGVIFQDGNYAEASVSFVFPNVTGTGAGAAPTPATPTPGVASGNMAPSYANVSFAYKHALSDRLDAAIIFDTPFGADTDYPDGTGYFAENSSASLRTRAFTGVARYKFNDNFSAIAGVRAQSLKAEASLSTPAFAGPFYTANAPDDYGLGFVVGGAYERKELGLRIALTYNSGIKHDLETTEVSAAGMNTRDVPVETPQSVNLEFQTGLNPKTLLFGAVRWVDWSEFNIDPSDYRLVTTSPANPFGEPLVSFSDDTITYSLGLGRRLNDTWAVTGQVTYEDGVGGFASNLAPTDGRTSVAVAAIYSKKNFEITTGVSYTMIGDAQTDTARTPGIVASDFTGNSAIAFGTKVGLKF